MKIILILTFAISAFAENGKKSAIHPVPSKNLFMTCEPDMTDTEGHWVEMICTNRNGDKSTWKRVPDIRHVGSHYDSSVKAPPSNLINGQINSIPPVKPIQIDEEEDDESAPRF